VTGHDPLLARGPAAQNLKGGEKMEKLGDVLSRSVEVFLPDPNCPLCHGKGEFYYDVLGKGVCYCENGLSLTVEEWERCGRPKDTKEYTASVRGESHGR